MVTQAYNTPTDRSRQELLARSLELLEFPRVREALASYAHLPVSRELALGLGPALDADTVRQRQQETAEARLLLDEAGATDLSIDRDARPIVRRAAMQGVLNGEDLLAVADTLDLIRGAKALGNRIQRRTPLLRAVARNIPDMRPLEREIRAKVTRSGELADDATPYLRQLRQESRTAYRRATRALEKIIGSDSAHEFLQEELITVRADRLVLPVKAEFRGRMPGIVHGVSDSGATLFVEPLATVALTNEWRERGAAEEEETLRILRLLTASVGKRSGDITYALEMAARIDLALAKARYAGAYRGAPIEIGGSQAIELVEARHPLLHTEPIPLSLTVGGPVSGLVITGPNTGGKTVALKTLGLMVLMHQSGLQLPCESSTRLPVVDGVYADIGDQQSIERSVSTFSSHISAITAVLAHATERSLVLLDELGTSTDPEEGSALARAILAHLADRGVPTVVTTHHRTVAAFAEEQPSLGNASVELDPATLRPTYRLTMGLPGRSYAMEVAERIGLDRPVVDAAKGFLDPAHRRSEALLAGIQEERHQTRLRLQEAEEVRHHAAALEHELETRLEELAHAQERLLEETRHELQTQVRGVMARLKQAEAAATWEGLAEPPPPRVIEEARSEVAEVQRLLRSRIWGRGARRPDRKVAIAVGDTVSIGPLGFTGTVVTAPGDDKKAEVLVGSARIRMDVERLRKVGSSPDQRPGRITVSLRPDGPVLGAEPELDLRGLRLHESLERLDAFLDTALAQGSRRLRVIHGKGTGVLRQGVWKHLAGHPGVGRFDFAPREAGGDGATEVELGGP